MMDQVSPFPIITHAALPRLCHAFYRDAKPRCLNACRSFDCALASHPQVGLNEFLRRASNGMENT